MNIYYVIFTFYYLAIRNDILTHDCRGDSFRAYIFSRNEKIHIPVVVKYFFITSHASQDRTSHDPQKNKLSHLLTLPAYLLDSFIQVQRIQNQKPDNSVQQ